MRTWGRVPNPDGPGEVWVKVETDANGYDDGVWLTTLVQCLKLNLGESPFFADSGIPAKQAVEQQAAPNFYVNLTQQRFSIHFAVLRVMKVSAPDPTYRISIITQQGYKLTASVPV